MYSSTAAVVQTFESADPFRRLGQRAVIKSTVIQRAVIKSTATVIQRLV